MSDTGTQAVERAARILDLLAEQSPRTVTQIATALGVHKSTASRLLGALRSSELVEPAPAARGGYRLGPALVRLARAAGTALPPEDAARWISDRTAAELALTANVAILDGHHAVNIAQTNPTSGLFVMRDYIGQPTPSHATSSGKALLAHARAQTQDEAAKALTSYTPRTLTTPAALREELARVRTRGWAASDQEWEQGVTAVAVALALPDGTVDAALSVTAPVHLLPPDSFARTAAQLRDLAARSQRWTAADPL